jgi:hypothetical protein
MSALVVDDCMEEMTYQEEPSDIDAGLSATDKIQVLELFLDWTESPSLGSSITRSIVYGDLGLVNR